ncbi:5818_t:CDS:2, partial [Dentiscutata erythropus]
RFYLKYNPNCQDIEPEVLDNQNVEPEILNNHDVELEMLAAYDSHGIRIGSGGRVNTKTKEIIKRSYLCRYAEKPAKSSVVSCRVECPWKVNFCKQFRCKLCKLPKEIVEEIRFLTTVAKADSTIQYRIIQEKYNVRIYQPDLYKTIQMFQHDSEPDEDDVGMFRYFIAGVQSTFRNEVCKLETNYSTKNAVKTIFELVIRQLNEFVMPNVMKKQEKQMNLSFYYHAIEVDLEVIISKKREVDESEQCIDNLFDCPQMQLKSFLNDFSIIVESWEVMHLLSSGTSHFVHLLNNGTFLCTYILGKSYEYPCLYFYHIMTLTSNARFHISLVNRRWYKDALQETNITNNRFIIIFSSISISISKAHILPTQFLHSEFDVNIAEEFANNVNQSPDEIFKAISKKRKFGELWGLERKIMINAIKNSKDQKVVQSQKELQMSLRSLMQKRVTTVVNLGSEDNEKSLTTSTSCKSVREISDTEEFIGPSNPVVLISASMQPIDFQNREYTQRQYSICHRKGHNSQTCPNKI